MRHLRNHEPSPQVLLSLQDASAGFGPSALTLDIRPGLTAVTGDEGTGKTTLLRLLARSLPLARGVLQGADAHWLDLQLPGLDEQTPEGLWQASRQRSPDWDPALCGSLAEALDLQPHLAKRLSMLSTGSRRKVGLVALLASGCSVTCIDQPYAALDMASVRVLRGFLQDMADHPARAWVVADYEADPSLPWNLRIALD